MTTVISKHRHPRHRGGRRWLPGENEIPAADLAKLDLAEIKADPLLRIKRPRKAKK